MAYASTESIDSSSIPITIIDPLFGESSSAGSIYDILTERRYGPGLSLKTKLYYFARPFIPLKVRQFLQHAARPRAVAEDWFVDTELLDEYARGIAIGQRKRVINFWPDGKQWAIVLTHDVETEVGFKNIDAVVRIEEQYGFRSSWNLVAKKYPIDQGYVEDLKTRGFEVGIHGYNHDGRDYLSRRVFRKRAKYVNEAIRRFGALGFRSPACQRNLEWLQELDIEYDASCFDVDPFQPMPGGTKSIWPFRAGKFIELPYTLPQDHVLFITLAEQSNAIWRKKTEWLIQQRGMACLITHPDYLLDKRLLGYYEDFLRFLGSKTGYWHGTPASLVEWWKARERSSIVVEGGLERIAGPAMNYGATALEFGNENGKIVFHGPTERILEAEKADAVLS